MAAQQQQKQQKQAAASVLQSFPFRAAVLALCVALLPLLPAQAPEAAGAGQAFLAKAWELLHLLVVGIAVSYGLFSRRNSADDGRVAATEKDHDDAKPPADARYVSRMLRDSLAPFGDDDDDEVVVSGSPGGREDGGGKVRSWSAMHRPGEPVVAVASGGRASGTQQAPLSLPVRMLKPQDSEETVLPSPIPWRSRSGRLDAGRPTSPRSPKRLSPASSSSSRDETLAKATEEYYSSKRRSPHKKPSSSANVSSNPPPAPPPPPPPFLVHGYHPPRPAARPKSFKEELRDHSMRGRDGDHRYSSNPSSSFVDISAYDDTNSSSSPAAKPIRSSFDGGSSSSSTPTAVGKSVRTFRAIREPPPVLQGQRQQAAPEDDVAGDGRDPQEEVHGTEEKEPYGYRIYQSIPRFQYERSVVSDPILGGVAVSSDETESSDDDSGGGGGGYSTRESTPEVDENEVDKKAEEFIARFREQIRRQRIESIKRSAGPRGVKHGK